MTIFGVDVSEHQNGMSLGLAKAEGIQFAIIRTTDGTYKDRVFQSHLADARGAGMVVAAYHYCRNPNEGTSIDAQVRASLEVMGANKLPMWLDCETNAGLSAAHIREFKQKFEAAGVRVIGTYSYVPWWEGKTIGGEPDSHEFGAFWVAAYGTNPRGVPSVIYPGDDHARWAYPLGNQLPALWQFGSNASVAGYSVDINAYRGTIWQLESLFYGGEGQDNTDNKDKEESMAAQEIVDKVNGFTNAFITGYLGPQINALQDVWTQLRGPGGKGWPQLGKNDKGEDLSPVDAIAAIRNDLAALQRSVNAVQATLNDIKAGK